MRSTVRVDPLAAASFVLGDSAVTTKNALFALFDGDQVLFFVDHVVLHMAVAIRRSLILVRRATVVGGLFFIHLLVARWPVPLSNHSLDCLLVVLGIRLRLMVAIVIVGTALHFHLVLLLTKHCHLLIML